ncbi:MAG: PEP-CTERM sorting domain-containing protein [Burkholderiales bacterium]|nr:PEP-CTERM sorting domain-containing protein [Burkholderiales bacterium]
MKRNLLARLVLMLALSVGALPAAQAGITVTDGVVTITDGFFDSFTQRSYGFNLGAGPYAATLVDTNVLYPFQSLGLEVKTLGGTSMGTLGAPGSFNFTSLAAGPYVAIVSGLPTALIPPLSTFGVTIAPVPEPEIWAMMAVGMGLLGFRLRRKAGGAQPA